MDSLYRLGPELGEGGSRGGEQAHSRSQPGLKRLLERKVSLESCDEGHVVRRLNVAQDVFWIVLNPRLRAAGPNVSHRNNPAGVVERSCPQTEDAIRWR